MKRYCQTLELMDDPDMIRRYCDVHKHVWPEIMEGQKQHHCVGATDRSRSASWICKSSAAVPMSL